MNDQAWNPWPHWQTARLLGKGSFGAVYEITRALPGTTEHSALKVIPLPADPREIEQLRAQGRSQEEIVQHFRRCLDDILREYSLMAEVKGHPNIVYCDDFLPVPRPDGIGWDLHIKMELLTPLFQVLPSHYSEAMTVQLGRDICRALVLCEKKGILHRDIKPENIFFSKAGSFKLGDFGVAKMGSRVPSGTTIGTFDYMAPEVYLGQPYGTAADQYSLGLLLYWTMNGHRIPFLTSGNPSKAEKEQAWKKRAAGTPLPLPIHGSARLAQVVQKACSFDPAQRYPSAALLLEALEEIQAAPFCPDPVASGFYRAPATLD